MEELVLSHLPQCPLQVCLFKDVENASFLRQQLLERDRDFEYAFLDTSVLLSRNHVLAACFRAINDLLNNRLKSRNVHAEIVFALSPNNNIAESFRRFGISDETKNILAIKVAGDPSQVESHLKEHVQGEPAAFSDETLAETWDVNRIRKIYRVDVKKGDVDSKRKAEAFILGTMALKGS